MAVEYRLWNVDTGESYEAWRDVGRPALVSGVDEVLEVPPTLSPGSNYRLQTQVVPARGQGLREGYSMPVEVVAGP